MAKKFTKKWLKDFGKRYTQTLKEFQELEKEFKDMCESNPDSWELSSFTTYDVLSYNVPKERSHNLGAYRFKDEEKGDYIEISIQGSQLVTFGFNLFDLKELIEFRNDLIKAIDEFQRPVEEKKEIVTDECDEEDENWENNEYTEYTIQASRTCVQTWTHTVQARTSCEAYRLMNEDMDGSTHDENDDLSDFGDITYEII